MDRSHRTTSPSAPQWRLLKQALRNNKSKPPLTNHSPLIIPNPMSSATATATTTLRQTYWCHECDMSVSLLLSSTSVSVPLRVLCPHCHSHLLELMDSHSHCPFPPQPHFLDFNFLFDFDFDDHDHDDHDHDHHPQQPNSLISSITTVQISDSLSQESCAICKDEFCAHSEAKQLPCKHLYHSHCILTWLSLHSSCPLCRFQLQGEIS